MTESLVGSATAAPLSMRATAVVASAVVRAARQLLTDLERGRRIDAAVLRSAMEAAFGASDATGAWNWKTAYDACEAATVLFLRRYGTAMRAKATSPTAMLPMLMRITSLLPTQTRRSEESESLQQFSTPIGLAFVASVAAAITPADIALDPSAGIGLLAILAELSGASLILNEFADSRAGILAQLFPAVCTTQFDAAHINDHLDAGVVPSVVLMNPPFSAAVHVDRKMADPGCSLETFEDAAGLNLSDANGLKDELPPITTFLNRLLALTIELQNVLFTAFERLLAARIEGAIASGTYDVGLETLRAESFFVTDRRAIYVHPTTGAETRLLTITQRERNRPVTLDDALGRLSDQRAVLLINERSYRPAVQIPAPSFMLDDGEIESRVRLIRPMEQHSVPLKMMAESHWLEADRERFSAAWLAELAGVPKFSESTIHIEAGLLLPIWKRLPNESTRVYRLQTDAGERIIGRKVAATWVANVLTTGAPELTPDAAFAALTEGRTVLDLAEGLQLRRVRVMGACRSELSGFSDTMRDRLRTYGLFGEIISWKLRMFVPTDASGAEVLAKLLDRYAIERIAEREAA
jgi:hypothetical protein